ncbi:Glycosyl transferase family 2 [Arthrobacter sp. 9V]|uniref:dolichyl-phosphate beta-glucosyltransferase n=1 Tax=Arthrobacter sp. 9V TaxID=2653132 RepID=UPI0012F3A0DE|nr:dolichyl-phosphate beta-glucosyltransferase [Arthrobacter sp. 9V]VXC20156.1 Glycosyl transferase family 2 [Arthrobacter sp. 9V]
MTLTESRPVLHQRLQRSPIDARMSLPVLDITLPVFNEEIRLEENLRRLHAHLTSTFPHTFRITVADNASTDKTLRIAERLARELPELMVVRFQQRARGNALRRVWLSSPAPVLAYMEADLSTDLSALAPLLAPLLSGHSDLAIGTRLARTSHSYRGAPREFISRGYNAVLRTVLGAGFSDAQSGFKAIRADVAQRLLPYVKDDGWFFDTELLVIAERSGLRVHEVPVDWAEDPNSSVDVVRTALADLRGMARLTRDLARGRVPVSRLRREIGREPTTPQAGSPWQGIRAVAWTSVYAVVFLLVRSFMDPLTSNLAALACTTFAARPPNPRPLTLGLTLLVSSLALAVLPLITTPGRWLEVAALAGASIAVHGGGYLAGRKTNPCS